jgi:2-C-methyl-D-erythritol 4-phosphate cytidylyltransferase
LIHDAARPLLSAGLLGRVLQAADEKGAVIPAIPLQETLKEVNGNRILQTLSRENYCLAQTPQAFQYEILRKSYETAGVRSRGALLTDESFLVEQAGFQVFIIPGERENIKITEMEDLKLAEFYLERLCST